MRYNQLNPSEAPFYWQNEYSVFSFDRKRLTNLIAYVEQQKDHHLNASTIPILEIDNLSQIHAVRDEVTIYGNDVDQHWYEEMRAMPITSAYPTPPADKSVGYAATPDESGYPI